MDKKYKVLVAEDEEYNFKLMKYILQREGIEILWAKNGEEAISLYKSNDSIDLIMMDLKMPVMNGIDATIEIKKIDNQIPVIAVTAYALAEDREKCMRSGFDEYVTKPVNREQLLSVTYKLLGQE